MEAVVNGRAMWTWIISLLAAVGLNAVLGSPAPPGSITLAWVAIPTALYLLSDRVAAGLGGRRLLIQEAYEAGQRRREGGGQVHFFDPLTDELRGSLDEAGQAAFDLLEDAIERRDLGDEGAT